MVDIFIEQYSLCFTIISDNLDEKSTEDRFNYIPLDSLQELYTK